ncbi:hypothetical protein [Stieleria bergensis]|uniref:hypothetical protein n=1 Tax=Stieleria bergensis TaxID=2528025 RepID=UPI003AF377E2
MAASKIPGLKKPPTDPPPPPPSEGVPELTTASHGLAQQLTAGSAHASVNISQQGLQ